MVRSEDLVERIRALYGELTRSERLIANQILAHPELFAAESSAALATKVGVSSMTVSRLIRKLGFDRVSDVRRLMRKQVFGPNQIAIRSIRDRYDAFASKPHDADQRQNSLDAEIAALRAAYNLTADPAWPRSVATVASRKRVYVHGLQVTRGLATEFGARLEFIRPNVYLADGQNGTFAEIVCDTPEDVCVVIIDIFRYARLTLALAEQASAAGIPIIVFSDEYCHWAREFTDAAFLVPTSTGLFWNSTSAMSAALNLMVSDVVAYLGGAARAYINQVLEAQEAFGQFLDASP